MTAVCPLCADRHQQPLLAVNGYSIVRCDACAMRFVSPMPTAEELRAFYQEPAYYADIDVGYSDYLGERAQHEAHARRRLARIERLVPGRGRILDVGCAAGFFLNVAQTRGWEPFGVELSAPMAAYARDLIGRPIAGTLDELGAAPGSFDAITLWEYIEHIPDPLEEIERLARLLRPGGVLALSTPNTGHWLALNDLAHWREYKPPAHLMFFTDPDLRRLLSANGLKLRALPHVMPRPPRQSYAIHRLLEALNARLGNGADRRTRFWWGFSLAWRFGQWLNLLNHQRRFPGSDVTIGLEAYAQKPA